MIKRIVGLGGQSSPKDSQWLELEQLAEVEITSEDPAFPIEAALRAEADSTVDGWRAAKPGVQLVRLIFREPQRLRRILLSFSEPERERTQEFVLRWSSDGSVYDELLRQQWNFNPVNATCQLEDFEVNLDGVRILELRITPDISGGDACASLTAFRVAP
jgi:hypothetical protein